MLFTTAPGHSDGVAFGTGDIFVGTGSGTILHYSPTFNLLDTLSTTFGGLQDGMAFDSSGNLYSTNFSQGSITKFSASGSLVPPNPFVTNDPGASNESLVFSQAGTFFVGQADGTMNIIERAANGTFIARFTVAVQNRGSDWIDLAADQQTIYYTSEGTSVKRFNILTNTQLPDFATGLPGAAAFALRILPNGNVLVADSNAVVLLDTSGHIIKTYTVAGATQFFGLNLLPDGTTFLTGDSGSGKVYEFDIATGQLLGTLTVAGGSIHGLTVDGEVTVAIPPTALSTAFWNGSQLSPNGAIGGGSGIWNNSSGNWTDSTGKTFGRWGGDTAIFGGTPGVVTLGDNINFKNIQFKSSGYVVNGAGFSLIASGAATISTDSGVSATINAAISAPGGVTKTGAGTLFLDGNLTGNVQVLQGMLGGTGSIFGNLNNSATVSPGDAPGTLHINGNYTQTSSGNLRIAIASSTNFSQLAVNGTANIDGTLTAVSVNGFKPKIGDKYTILTATGGVNGFFKTFDDQTGSGILSFKPVYTDPNQVTLSTVAGSAVSLLEGAGSSLITGNRLATAQALDAVADDPRFAKVFEFLAGDNLQQFVADLDRIAHEEVSSLHNSSTSVGSVQTGNIANRTAQIRAGFSGFSALGFHMAGSGPLYAGGLGGPSGDDGKETKEMKSVAPYNPRLGAFLTGVGEWVNVDDTPNARGYDVATGGFTVGVDYKFTERFAMGVNAGYANTGVDLNDGSHMRINAGKFGLYSTYFNGGFYIDAAAQGGFASYDSRRAALAGDARGSTSGGDFEALFGTGYDFHAGGLTIGPTGNFQYGYNEFNSFTEHGSLVPLHFPSQSQESYRSAFGMKAIYELKARGVTWRPELRLAWQHEYGTTTYPVTAEFAGANNNFTVEGPRIGRDSLLLGAGMTVLWNERVSSYVYYNGEYARTNFLGNTVSGGIRVTF